MNRPSKTTWIEVSGIGITVLILAIAQGIPGIIAGGLLAIFWYISPPLYTVGYGQIALSALLVPTGTTVQIAIAEIGLLLILLAPGLRLDQPLVRTMTTLGGIVLLAGGVIISFSWNVNHEYIGVILISILGVVTYSMHRYERVAVGAVEEPHE